MTTNTNWGSVDVLIPRRFHEAREAAVLSARLDHAALIEALPVASPLTTGSTLASFLADADADDCRAWITRVIEALPTQADMEAANGDA